ncbi:MAG: SO_0444 family Cu/Zn efflux transporter [Planctomycetota bacterium]
MAAFLLDWGVQTWAIVVESGVWLVLGFLLAGVVHALVPKGFIERQLGGRGVLPIAKASALGLPMPLCSCSVIPVAAGLRRGGAGKGASAAFAISTPQTGEESIPLTWALFGPAFALVRPVAAVFTAFTAGLLIDRFETRSEKPDQTPTGEAPSCGCAPKDAPPAPSSCCSSAPVQLGVESCCASNADTPDRPALGARIHAALQHAFVTMPRDLALWLTIGLILAGLVSAAVPIGWFEQVTGEGWWGALWPMLAMLMVGVPLYICATSSTPLAATLVAAGLSPGAALVLLLAGPATNVATVAWALKDLGLRATIIYLATIAVCALACGIAVDLLFSGMISVTAGHAHDHASTHPIMLAGAAAFVAIMLPALAHALWKRLPSKPARTNAEPAHGT